MPERPEHDPQEALGRYRSGLDYGGPRREPAPSPVGPHPADPDLRRLRAARRRPVFTVVGVVVGLYVINALLASEVRSVMAVQVAGPLNFGLGLALFQCVTTVWAIRWYARHATTVLDHGSRLGAQAKQRRHAR
ncbi:DUF485 domain-containing protein [Streptomyces sp. NA02950]|uniref:DUF485 domain-containing protein n=1 Tax=Streptomyces sp. NA02950 TaxID=2742137 RepID=UPI00159063AD|nr:DUF485 domain-containing protein [Streptomyces sp. NA02950]QKV96206.1 DUF485 domain-containing protein [Streptomyces sp. NA02950]